MTSASLRARGRAKRLFVVLAALSLLVGISSGVYLSFAEPAQAAPISAVDDQGADDEPGQKDLNELSIDYGLPGATELTVKWNWDDTATSGANTRDGGALFDTDADGMANYSLYVTVAADGSHETQLYLCTADSRADRCGGPSLVGTFTSTASVATVADSDPFGVPGSAYYDPTHVTGNTCDAKSGCYTDDTVATALVRLADFGNAADVSLINVCSYPSGEPNSDPSDCVFEPNTGFLTIVKAATPSDTTEFTFNASAPSASGDSTWKITGSGSVPLISYAATTALDLTELVPAGWKLDSAACAIQTATPTATGAPTPTGVDDVTIAEGLETICTFNDSLSQGTLKVIKTVVNDNGGALGPADFSVNVKSGGTDVVGSPAAGVAGPGGRDYVLLPGTYVVSEDAPPTGYAQTSIVCDGVATDTVTVVANATKTCTITNDDRAPALRLRKLVTNDDGGSELETAWTLSATGSGIAPTNLSGTTPVDSGAAFKADTYTLAESGPAGYLAGAWSCVVTGTQISTPLASGAVTVGLGDDVTCTITNDDQAASLTLNKLVVNDNGGSAVASSWTLTAAGPSGFSGAGPTVASGPGFDAGTYTLAESGGPSGYTASAWVCTGGSQAGNQITVGLSQSATCTITNDDQAPALHLRKTVVDDNGGTAAATDWTLSATGTLDPPTNLSGTTPVDSAAGFKADTYTLAESGGPFGYTASAWVCTGGSQAGNQITVGLGQSATCTITNNDDKPQLKLVKSVINNNGGTATAADWKLSATAADPKAARNFESQTASPVFHDVFAGVSYALAESTLAGYSTTGEWACDGGTLDDAKTAVTVPLGAQVTCTITNDDQAGTLIVKKQVVNDNGGTKKATDFSFKVGTADPVAFTQDGTDELKGLNTLSRDAGAYAITEPEVAGYTTTYDGCSGTLANGETKTCTIANDDVAPELHLRKVVVNDSGGAAAATAWTLNATGSGPSPTNLSGTTPVDSGPGFKAGTYALAEVDGPAGYAAADWQCTGGTQTGSSITLAVGQQATCTITNNDFGATLVVRKLVVNDNGGIKKAIDFSFQVDGGGPVAFVQDGADALKGLNTLGRNAGAFAVTEPAVAGYTTTYDGCTGTIGVGETKTCTIRNDDVPKEIDLSVIKVDKPDPVVVGATLTYTLAVRNTGPDTATNVTLVDSLPAATKFVSVKTEQGTCSGGTVVRCSLGSIAPGGRVLVTIVVRPLEPRTVVNSATVAGDEPEPNKVNNTASATTLVLAPFRPPAVTCPVLKVQPRSMPQGKKTLVKVLVTRAGKGVPGVRVVLTGPGVKRAATTDRRGRAAIGLRPPKAGIISIRMANQPARCSTRRIGVVGVVATLPVTG